MVSIYSTTNITYPLLLDILYLGICIVLGLLLKPDLFTFKENAKLRVEAEKEQ